MKIVPSNQTKMPKLTHFLIMIQALGFAYSATSHAAGETLSLGSKVGDQSSYAGTTWASLSAEGRYIALTGVSGFLPHIYLYDRYLGTSLDLTPQVNNLGMAPDISANGQYVVFGSSASNLTTDDSNGFMSDIFIYDVRNKSTRLLSKASDGTQGNNSSQFSAISNDGQFVAFSSSASNLTANDTNNAMDVFLHDRKTAKTSRVSLSSAGEQAETGISNGIVGISGNGQYVVFSSYSSNLVAGDTVSDDVFLRDTKAGTTTWVSRAVRQTGFDGQSRFPSISNDGRYIAFQSGSSKLVDDDTDDVNSDIFIYDRVNKKSTKITRNANGNSILPTISANGNFVGFISQASNLVDNDTNGTWDTFVYDRQSNTTTRINITPQDLQSAGDPLLILSRPDLSADGRFIGFESAAKDLSGNDTDNVVDVFLRDRLLNKQKNADIKLTLSAPKTVVKGQQYTYALTVANLGPVNASRTNAIINLPGSLTIDSVVPSQGSCVKALITQCQLGNINSGVDKQIQVKVKVKALSSGTVNVSASAESVEKDSVYGNNAVFNTVVVN